MNLLIRLILRHWPMGVIRFLLAILFFQMVMWLFCSCRTAREVERITVHDTLRSDHTDTLTLWKTKYLLRDTIARDTVLIERDTTGRVIYKEVTRLRTLRLHHTDTVFLYRSASDTTAHFAAATTTKQSRHTLPPTWIFFTSVAAMIIFGGGAILLKRKNCGNS